MTDEDGATVARLPVRNLACSATVDMGSTLGRQNSIACFLLWTPLALDIPRPVAVIGGALLES